MFDFMRWQELPSIKPEYRHSSLNDYIGKPDEKGRVPEVWLWWKSLDQEPEIQRGRDGPISTMFQEKFWKGVIVRLNGNGLNKQVLIPRGHLKSTICNEAHTLWEIIREPGLRHCVRCQNTKLSRSFLANIKYHFDSNKEFQSLFGDLRPGEREAAWNADAIQVLTEDRRGKEPTLMTFGMKSEVVGFHYDRMKLDDIVGEKNSESRDMREAVRDAIQRLEFVRDPHCPLVNIGTIWAEDDAHSLFIRPEGGFYDTSSFIAATVLDEDQKPLWPQVFTYEVIEQKRKACPNDYIWFCFPEETTILCRSGIKQICDVKVGEEVLTHKNRWRKVIRTGSHKAKTIHLRGQGLPELITTPDHPIYASRRKWGRRGKKGKIDEPHWVKAQDMQYQAWASPSNVAELPIPEFEYVGRELKCPEFSKEFFWVVGAWLGDGWIINDKYLGCGICTAKNEADFLESAIKAAGLKATRYEAEETTRFTISSGSLARWLRDNFGEYCHGKTVPTWALGMCKEWRESLLAGYKWADGCDVDYYSQATTVSKMVAIGVKLLAQTLGYSVSLHKYKIKKTKVIKGRTVNQSEFYTIVWRPTGISSYVHGDHRYGLVKKIWDGVEREVFNLEVEEDNSYTADGITVHNCQYYNQPYASKSTSFQSGWWAEYAEAPEKLAVEKKLNIYIAVDPANSKNKQSDYSAAVVVGQSASDPRYRYILDGIRDKLGPAEIGPALVSLIDKWQRITDLARTQFRFAIEQYGFQQYIAFNLRNTMRDQGIHCAIEELQPRHVNKEDRIKRLLSPFSTGSILAPKVLAKKSADGKRGYDFSAELKHEFTKFPRAAHDDVLDALAYVEEMIKPLEWAVDIKKDAVIDTSRAAYSRERQMPEEVEAQLAQNAHRPNWFPAADTYSRDIRTNQRPTYAAIMRRR